MVAQHLGAGKTACPQGRSRSLAAAGGVRPGRLRRVPADFPPLFFSRCFCHAHSWAS